MWSITAHCASPEGDLSGIPVGWQIHLCCETRTMTNEGAILQRKILSYPDGHVLTRFRALGC
jgi:hypothetical protein